MARPLINVPAKVKRGQVFEIKTLISHIMETGFRYASASERVPRDIITFFSCRYNSASERVPRDIITFFSCLYNGEEIFSADFYPAISANPFLTFFTTATESGTLDFKWIGDNGFSETTSVPVTVE